MIARPFELSDLDAARRIMLDHKSMYGVDIDHESYVKTLLVSTEESLSVTVEHDGRVFGIAKQHQWAEMPNWSVGSMFFNSKINGQTVLMAGKALLNFMTARAESFGRYDFYYVVRDSESTRKNLSMRANPEFARRYDVVDVEVILPFQQPRYKVFAGMLADLAGNNSKTLVVRHGYLRPEFRQDVWKKM